MRVVLNEKPKGGAFEFLKRNRMNIQFFLLIIILILALYAGYFVFEQKNYNLVLREKFLTFFYDINFFARKSALPIYKITIPQKSSENLEADMPDIDYVLENPFSWQPAVFEFNGRKYNVELKYRGVYASHWRHEKKNMAIRFPQDKLFRNKEKLLLIIPEAMSMMPNSLNSYSAEVLGLPSPKTEFVQVYVNGKYCGVYEDSENVDRYFLENHNLPIGDIYDIELDVDSFLLDKWANEDYDVYWNRLSVMPGKNNIDTTNLASLLYVYNLESDKEFREEIEKILDIDEYLYWAAHNYFSGTTRQSDHNIKLYYNPEINKFWQIPWDLEGYSYNGYTDLSINAISNGLMNRILEFPDYNYRKNQIIWKYLNNELSAENQLKKLNEFYNEIKKSIYKDPHKRATRKAIWYSNNDFDESIKEVRDWILERDKNLRLQLSQGNAMLKFENQGFWKGTDYYLRFRLSTAWGVGAKINELLLPLTSKNKELLNNLTGWQLYQDSDHNGNISYGDELLMEGQPNQKRELRLKLNTFIFPDKSNYDPSQPVYKLEMFKDPISSLDFIIKLDFRHRAVVNRMISISVGKNLEIESFNAVTDEVIETAISFVDEIYYDSLTKGIGGDSEVKTSFNFKEFLYNEAPQ